MERIKPIIINLSSVFARIIALFVFLVFIQQVYLAVQIGFDKLGEVDVLNLVSTSLVSLGATTVFLAYSFMADDWKDYSSYKQEKQLKHK